jgi:rhodanese-related sulfurtransferase
LPLSFRVANVCLDVREPAELTAAGKIPNALNLPLSSLQETLSLSPVAFREKFEAEKPGKDKEVIFYCKAGVRSTNASNLAKEAGYPRIGNYTGSFDDWLAKYPFPPKTNLTCSNGKISKA